MIDSKDIKALDKKYLQFVLLGSLVTQGKLQGQTKGMSIDAIDWGDEALKGLDQNEGKNYVTVFSKELSKVGENGSKWREKIRKGVVRDPNGNWKTTLSEAELNDVPSNTPTRMTW